MLLSLGRFVNQFLQEFVQAPNPLITPGVSPYRHLAFVRLALADDQHVRHLLQLRFPYFVPDFLVATVNFHADAGPR